MTDKASVNRMEVRMTGLAKTGRTAQTRQETEQTSRMYLENYTLKNQLKNLNSRDWKQMKASVKLSSNSKTAITKTFIITQTTQEDRNFKTSEIKKDLFEPIQRIRENQEPRPIPITLYKDAGQANKSAGWMPWH